ncbi:MAG: hypothetical protein HN855_11080 [Anaerolineae bacterium]|jgi:hypothetical protein|nr:hypothetical protein [Anaerolineae bacterium]MBT7069985.1 hypothetical protein [Anaerolineae bacterium]MBT7325695.1 hypothetical protein [Anaerolineae bacterium]
MSDIAKTHREFATQSFNAVWDLLDKQTRTADEDVQMIHLAHASRYHWSEIGTPLEFARGDWQISRVYATLGFGVMAFKYAKRCLDLCEKDSLGDFDLAFAYEALARASAVSGDLAKGQGYLSLAKDAGLAIKEEDDRDYFFRELTSVEELL